MDNKMASFGGRREFQRKSHWKFFLFLIFLTAFLVSGGLLLRNLYRSQQEQAAYDALAEQVHQMEKQIAEGGGGALPTEDGVLPQYQALWEKNQDLAGWLSIEGTAIDYPVMHTAQDEEYYLRRAFDRSNSVSGTPFLAAGCFTGCGNYIIYGHNMKDGSMFAALLNYADDTFWEEHPTIRFDTPGGDWNVSGACGILHRRVTFRRWRRISLLRIHGSTRRSHLPRVSRSGRGQGAL